MKKMLKHFIREELLKEDNKKLNVSSFELEDLFNLAAEQGVTNGMTFAKWLTSKTNFYTIAGVVGISNQLHVAKNLWDSYR